eukprot:scaffold5766_cov256-Pinguiococcus_pyrenoidosus.AAC.8
MGSAPISSFDEQGKPLDGSSDGTLAAAGFLLRLPFRIPLPPALLAVLHGRDVVFQQVHDPESGLLRSGHEVEAKRGCDVLQDVEHRIWHPSHRVAPGVRPDEILDEGQGRADGCVVEACHCQRLDLGILQVARGERRFDLSHAV